MATFRFRTISSRDPDDALDLLADMRNASTWDPTVTRVIRLDDGPIQVGSCFDVTVALGRRAQTFRYEVLTYTPGTSVVLHAETRWLVSHDTVLVRPVATGTEVRYDAVLRGRGFARLAAPFFALVIRRIGRQASRGLAERLSP